VKMGRKKSLAIVGRRRGLTLAELLVATTIMLMIATAVGTLASAVHSTNDFCRGYTVAAQHARVALSRIERSIQTATASEQFPGCLVVTEQAGSDALPTALVVWSPTGTAANPKGLPLISEIVVFAPDPARPNNLLEIRSPTEMNSVPATGDAAGWQSLTNRLRASSTVNKIVLTDRLRTAPITGDYSDSLMSADLRGMVRFRRILAPTEAEFSQYRGGTKTWQSLAWPLDSYRSTSGTRVIACQTELQIVTGTMATAASTAIPFYGSSSITCELTR
jgi:prepilin-type N-terminal cleavage/methylation domain-containing protein